jgi:glutathione peroxidase-family protein
VPAITQPGELRMDAFPEHVVLVDFWASHVAQSKRELRALGELHQALSEQPFTILGVCLDAVPLDRARDRAQQWNSPYPVGLADAEAADAFGGLRVMPTRYLVDRQHRVRETYAGGVPLETIRANIEALLAE